MATTSQGVVSCFMLGSGSMWLGCPRLRHSHRISRYVPAISTKAYSCHARHVSGSRLIWLEYSGLRLPKSSWSPWVVSILNRDTSIPTNWEAWNSGTPPQPMSPSLASTQPNLTSMQARPDPKSHRHVTRRIRSLVTRGYFTRFGKAVP